ncbi:MAG: thioredoxin family protein [Bacteroidales bacterium]|nr:thioredoxin family protein [Bacteroidales bacterium]
MISQIYQTGFLLVFSLLISTAFAQNDSILVGKVNRAELQKDHFGQLFLEEYKQYHPNNELLENFGSDLYDLEIILVMATWCHDSQLQVPRFFKILDLLNYNTSEIDIYTVDKQKLCGDFDISNFNIELVPTFIFYRDGAEIGRIIESPLYTLEKDMLMMLND